MLRVVKLLGLGAALVALAADRDDQDHLPGHALLSCVLGRLLVRCAPAPLRSTLLLITCQ